MKYTVFFIFMSLSACSILTTADNDGENPFPKYPARPIFKDVVYDNPKWLAKCEEYVMEECFY